MGTIDLVIPWVDGADPNWIQSKKTYLSEHGIRTKDDGDYRYRDFGTLKYIFRGIEKFMPWVRNVYLITSGQKPEWLNQDCDRLRLVDHSEYIPKEYLPTFSSHTIELNMHRIEGLSDQFIYFNDDIFVLREMKESDFFKDGLPCDSAVMDIARVETWGRDFKSWITLKNMEIINRHFDKTQCVKDHWEKYFNVKYGKSTIKALLLNHWTIFTGFYDYHFPSSIKKQVLAEIWEKEPDILDATCRHRLRSPEDVNIWLVLYWQYASGQFMPRNPKIGCFKALTDDLTRNVETYNHIRNQKSKFVVVNDDVFDGNAVEIGKGLREALQEILPEFSSFELMT